VYKGEASLTATNGASGMPGKSNAAAIRVMYNLVILFLLFEAQHGKVNLERSQA
jgi:hypothetical protein